MKLYAPQKKHGRKALAAILIAASLVGGAFAAVTKRIAVSHPEDGLYLVFPKTPMTLVKDDEISRLYVRQDDAVLWRTINYNPERGFSLDETPHVSFRRNGAEILVCGQHMTLTRTCNLDAISFRAVNTVVCDDDTCRQKITVGLGEREFAVYEHETSAEQERKLAIAHDALVSYSGTMIRRAQEDFIAARSATEFKSTDTELDDLLDEALGDPADISCVVVFPDSVTGDFSTQNLNEWTYVYADPANAQNKIKVSMDDDGVVTQEQVLPNGHKLTIYATKSGAVQFIETARYRDMNVSYATTYNPDEIPSLTAQVVIEHDLPFVKGAASEIAYSDAPKYSEDQMATAGAKVLYNAQTIDTRFPVPILRDIQGADNQPPARQPAALEQGSFRRFAGLISRFVFGS